MNPVIQLTVERGQHLTTAEMFMNAGIVILVVFGVLLLMYILISISGKIIQAITKAGSKKELGDKARSYEDVLSYIAFPQVAEKFFAAREEKESNTVNYTIEKKED